MPKKNQLLIIFTFIFFVINNQPAHAYLDPGTGSIVLQAIIGFIAAGLAVIKIYWAKFKSFFKKLFFKKDK